MAHGRPAPDGTRAAPGPDPRAVRVSGPAGEGVGHLLGAGLLLTSAETAGTGATSTFRLPGTLRPWRCSVVWHRYDPTRPRAERLDAALLRVLDTDWDEQHPLSRRSPPPRWGRLATRRPSVPVRLTAFPDGDARVVHGTVNAGSAVKAGRYHVTLPGPAAEGRPTPWPGVPGAAVLCHGLVLGVVADAVREPGTAWLSVVPAAALLRDPDFRALAAPGPLEAAELQPALEEGPTAGQGPEAGETDSLTRWCEGQDLFSVRLVVGAGSGHRRRLARTLVQRMSGRGWAAGFAADADERALGVVADTCVPLLLVVDRADTRPGTLHTLLDGVARRAFAGPAARVRLLLLAAGAGEWWWEARSESPPLRDLPADTVLTLSGSPSPSP
ncbi:hypothetical protein [Streptomyces kebangsaanensis]|uniref:hypothetical protein n=1 Tax=Streptomyces kebangsaanensis TaxID=864058 RepID=UPI00093F1242|nr:hypothetical protein [Streptomyces kebangsaanensis]